MFCYVETAFHHQGDHDYMLGLINAAAEVGADGIKFQILLDPSSFITSFHPSYDELATYIFSLDQWLEFSHLAKTLGLKLVVMPCDYEAFRFCHLRSELFDFLELHSVNLRDKFAMHLAALCDLPVVLGVGGRYDSEVEQYIEFFGSKVHSLVVGFQSFPTKPDDVCLERIRYLSAKYSDLLIGYADHTSGSDSLAISLCSYAYALGARMFELHLQLPGSNHQIDSQSAHSKSILTSLFSSLRVLNGFEHKSDIVESKTLNNAENKYRLREKKVVVKRAMRRGQIVEPADICLKLTGSSAGFGNQDDVVGKRLNKDICFDSVLTVDDFIL